MKPLRGKRAISPLIATIILVAITIVGGLLIYSMFYSTSGTLSAKGQITVEAVDLVKDTDGNIVFTITLKNSGNKPINATNANRLNVTLGSDSVALTGGTKKSGGTLPNATNLQPGQSISVDLYYSNDGDNTNDDIAGTYVVGNKYNVAIQAVFSDGSTFATTTSVMCRSG